MIDRFAICLPLVLEQEAPDPQDWSNPRNFSNDPGDPGGATFMGITHREYDIWRKHQGMATRPVRMLTAEEGEEIYHASYWQPYCEKLGVGLDLEFFDSSVNEGTTEAVKILQHALAVTVDGRWGNATKNAVDMVNSHIPALIDAVKAFTARRDAVYRQSANFRLFGTDWERRTSEIGAAALKMAQGAPA